MPLRRQYIHSFCAENGLEIRLRPLWPSDGPFLIDIFEHMSAQSRYLRFNMPLPDPDPDWIRQQAERLAYVRPYEGRAWLAFADLPEKTETAVGGVRLVTLSHDSAEVALVVRDDLQGIGIGTHLLEFAARKAYAEGYRKLVGIIHGTNLPLWLTLKRLGVPFTSSREGATTIVEVDLEAVELFRRRVAPDDSKTSQHYDK